MTSEHFVFRIFISGWLRCFSHYGGTPLDGVSKAPVVEERHKRILYEDFAASWPLIAQTLIQQHGGIDLAYSDSLAMGPLPGEGYAT